MFCPEIKDEKDLVLMGTRASHVQKRVEFQILKCNTQSEFNEVPCKNNEAIEDYLEDIEVEIYVTNLKIDYAKYTDAPTFAVQQYVSSTLLDQKFVQTDYVNIQYNGVQMMDDLL